MFSTLKNKTNQLKLPYFLSDSEVLGYYWLYLIVQGIISRIRGV